MSRARELARLGNPNTVSADSSSNVGFGTQVPSDKASSTTTLSAGIITATTYYGDGQFLDGVASAGLGTAIDDNKDNAANDIYYVNQVLTVAGVATITTPASTQVAYTNYSDIEVADGGELIVDQGEQFVPDVLGIGTGLQNIISQSQGNGIFGSLYVDNIRDAAGRGGPTFPDGATVTGVLTATTGSFSGNVSIGGTLTYEDVTNIDSVGLITARKGINVTAGVSTFAAGIIVSANGANITGVTTSTSFSGNINADDISSGIVTSARLGGGSASATTFLNGVGQFASPGGGPWKLLETSATPNNTASLTFTISSYTDYPIIRFIAPRIVTAAASANYAVPNLRIIQSGSTVTAANYNNGYIAANALPGLPNGGGTQKENKTSFYLGVYDAPLNYFQIDLVNPHSTTSTVDFPSVTGWTEAKDHQGQSGPAWSQRANWTGHYDGSGSDTVAVTGVVIYMGNLAGTAKNMESGSLPIKMYGLDGY